MPPHVVHLPLMASVGALQQPPATHPSSHVVDFELPLLSQVCNELPWHVGAWPGRQSPMHPLTVQTNRQSSMLPWQRPATQESGFVSLRPLQLDCRLGQSPGEQHSWQLLLQLSLPGGHWPSQGLSAPMQAPRQSLVPLGQAVPQLVPSHVAEPPKGLGHAVHETPHVATCLSSTQASPQR
jgi:hypothetical protein